ncbi:hypothetical protein QTP88_019376 [Uroleucon formosanum]
MEQKIKLWIPKPIVNKTSPSALPMENYIIDGKTEHYITINGRSCINFATHNYFNFISDKSIESNVLEAVNKYGIGSCGPRAFYGTFDIHIELEQKIAKFMEMEEAVIYSYGFSTVTSAIQAYIKSRDIVYVDEEVNFAIQKGLQSSKAELVYFKHNCPEDLERLILEKNLTVSALFCTLFIRTFSPVSRKHIMTQNNDLLSSELNKWTKSMLVDYIVAQTLPAGVKLSDDLSKFLKDSSSDPVLPSHGNSINIVNILQSVVVELKSVALSNAKLHDKLNHLNAAPNAQTPKSNAQLFKRPVDVHPNSVTGNRSTQPTNQLTSSQSSSVKNSSSKLSSVPVRKHVDIFVSRLDPSVTTALLESELFNGYPDVTISKMVTRHPSYSSFHIRLPADKLDIVLDPAFWTDSVMVKRFWGCLAPEIIQDATPKN